MIVNVSCQNELQQASNDMWMELGVFTFMLGVGEDVGAADDADAGRGVRRAQVIGGAHRVLARIERRHADHVQRHETKVEVRLEARTDRDRLAVEVPFDAHGGIAHRFEAALEVHILALGNRTGIGQRNNEDRARFRDFLDVVLRLLLGGIQVLF